jgi:colanic acid biosynthesis glycosyl transferase WcaI
VFAPDGVSTAQIMSDVAEDLQSAGNSVSVITTLPHQAPDVAAASAQPIRQRWLGLLGSSSYRGIPVLHTWASSRGRSTGGRLVTWLSFHFLGFLAALTAVERPDVIIVPSPLLSAGFVAWCITAVRGGRYIYNVQEMYPDLAVRMGALKNPLLIACLRWLERFVYNRASAITVIGGAMERALLEKGVPRGKVHLVPNFVDLKTIVPVDRRNAFSHEFGLTESFVVSYAGNMGRAQGLERLLAAASLLTKESTIRLVFVGEGARTEALRQQAADMKLPNVQFVPHQPFARVPEIYGASDVCVVPMIDAISGEAIPSKVYRIMAAERPILALTAREGDLGSLVRSADIGVVLEPATPDAIAAAVLALKNDADLCRAMGARGRARVEGEFSRGRVARDYAALVQGA